MASSVTTTPLNGLPPPGEQLLGLFPNNLDSISTLLGLTLVHFSEYA